MPEAFSRHVFVYGTLRRGGRNDINRLRPAPEYVGMGEVQGVLYHFDWYPGLTLGGEEAVTVVGEVYRITPELEAVLDRIEQIVPGADSEYFKREVDVNVEARVISCLLYEINAARIRGRQAMGHGDWILFHTS
ncbi:gamma-glutamylcyclotransferase [Ramlibacter ginsenosidimutans]|uniref:Gamma-glutamylcyclotransferase n=1 Tax=Ramlibacter ginsenosidimutans TaxID=502333 RepID=A0A934WNP8_9BURK|nr:gamma-glutamylcyclotransferase family protein [Ramlibacter ginsenosidimutans]MBK6007472.1 gamma-glutamylcyclotransferase [Ramlibacter ginsenosidimutans]